MPRHLQLDFIRVGGRYRIGKLLGSGGSGGYKFDSSGHIFLSFLGSVYLGKDIRTGAEVALKIGRAGPQATQRQGSIMNTTCIRKLQVAQAFLRFAGMAKKAILKSSFWTILEPRLAIWSMHNSSTSQRHSFWPPKWCVH